MNEHKECYRFTKRSYICTCVCRYFVSELHYLLIEFDLWDVGYQNIKNPKERALKKVLLYVFMYLRRRLLWGRLQKPKTNQPTNPTTKPQHIKWIENEALLPTISHTTNKDNGSGGVATNTTGYEVHRRSFSTVGNMT